MNNHTVDIGLVTGDGISHLLSFLPAFSISGVEYGKRTTFKAVSERHFNILPATLSETAAAFIQACYDKHFVQPFDWGEWSRTYESELNSEAFIKEADIKRIIKLLTTHVRADRFCYGHLLSVFENGTIVRILKRLEQINCEQSPQPYPEGRAVSTAGSAEV